MSLLPNKGKTVKEQILKVVSQGVVLAGLLSIVVPALFNYDLTDTQLFIRNWVLMVGLVGIIILMNFWWGESEPKPNVGAQKKTTCEWSLSEGEDYKWESACGFEVIFNAGNPKDNGVVCCPYCEGKVTINTHQNKH